MAAIRKRQQQPAIDRKPDSPKNTGTSRPYPATQPSNFLDAIKDPNTRGRLKKADTRPSVAFLDEIKQPAAKGNLKPNSAQKKQSSPKGGFDTNQLRAAIAKRKAAADAAIVPDVAVVPDATTPPQGRARPSKGLWLITDKAESLKVWSDILCRVSE
ncbi:MAG: uncharacterized protein KVP18_004872 [Porospora cf. gigantea A]|nr:MAG: hypothetical protein KVP18_004872 [Porospora cf. gigantea A]